MLLKVSTPPTLAHTRAHVSPTLRHFSPWPSQCRLKKQQIHSWERLTAIEWGSEEHGLWDQTGLG